jgi:O-antigen ligase
VDSFAVDLGPAKIPLGLLFIFGVMLLILHSVVATRQVPQAVVRSVLLWLCFLCAWLLSTAYGDQSITEPDLRLLAYSASIVPIAWLTAEERDLPLALGILVGILLAVAIGFERFVTFSGGEPAEHAIGYWGIKYLPSTRNSDAFYPLAGLAVALHFLHAARTAPRRSMAAFLILPLVAAVVLSSSRGAWLGLFFLVTFDLFRTSRRSLFRLGATAAVATAALALVMQTWPELTAVLTERANTLFSLETGTGGSNVERLELLAAATTASLHGFLGAGVGGFGETVGYTNVTGHALNHAENLLLTVSVEQGLLGLAIYGVLSITLIRSALRGGLVGNVAVVVFSHSLLNYELNSLFYWVLLSYALTRITVHGTAAGAQRRKLLAPSAGFDPLAN